MGGESVEAMENGKERRREEAGVVERLETGREAQD